ncbi:hypothetical protein V5P93_007379 [Actinokineospora auranticolor]|uniref:Collagen triple helix repeat protein n=1 Tax=Actinokineospora auranticolor TaxID=155976 RepID=A0A2S6GSC8_9PSEU|nr:hypothetical protein [Actinokineospora auranticolor]PPK68031.1 hypothetical protein CLV40_106264 [Actinokineospora auranticolor]
MRRRGRAVAVGLTVVIAGTTTGLLAGTGTAAAAPPIVVGSCATTVQGAPGTPIALSPTAVLDPVLRVVNAVPLVGQGIAGGVRNALSAMGNIPIGTVLAGDSMISGGSIAAAAVPRIRDAIGKVPLIGPVLGGIIGDVQQTLTAGCAITVKAVNDAVAPVQDGAGAVAGAVERGAAALPQLPNLLPGTPGTPGKPGTNPGTQPGTNPGTRPGGTAPGGGLPGPDSKVVGGVATGAPPLFGTGRAPMTDYTGIPFAPAGLFSPAPGVRYGGTIPGYAPQFGILGAGDADGVQAAGRAEALDAPGGNKIALPVLLAVFALSGVTAALVRTWVLRKTPA